MRVVRNESQGPIGGKNLGENEQERAASSGSRVDFLLESKAESRGNSGEGARDLVLILDTTVQASLIVLFVGSCVHHICTDFEDRHNNKQ